MIKRKSVSEIILMLMFICLSWGDFQIKSLYFFVILQVLYCVSKWIVRDTDIFFCKSLQVNLIYILLMITTFVALVIDIPSSFKKYSIEMACILLVIYFTYTYLYRDISQNSELFDLIIKCIKIGFVIQLLYIPVQYVAYKVLNIDINDLVFREVLSLMENPSFIRQGEFHPSGFVWHSAVLAPMLVLAILLFKNVGVRCLIVFDALICGNSTALIGVIITLGLLLFFYLCSHNYTISKRRMIILLVAVMTIACLIMIPQVSAKIVEKFISLANRVLQADGDSSSSAHISYYLLYPQYAHDSNILQVLFGTGYASSGNAISVINGQYRDMAHWVVESDIMDILISRGIVGFISYYFFLGYIAIEGYKIDCKYLIAILVIVLQGITYNVQFEYIFVIELLMYASIRLKYNFFEAGQFVKVFN